MIYLNYHLKNGLKRSWSEWNIYYGSVLCLEFGTDIVLNNEYQAEGVRGNFMLQMNLIFLIFVKVLEVLLVH